MNNHEINHNALTHLIEANAVSVATAKADGDIWTLSINSGETNKTMMAKNSGKARVWRKLDTLAKYLKGIGLDKFEIDVSQYDPSQKSLTRPDSARTLKQTHKVHKRLQEISDRTKLNTDQTINKVKEKWEERRAKILQEENPRARVATEDVI